MPEGSGRNVEARSEDVVEFGAAGQAGTGEYHCSACGYGVVVQTRLPRCPMCSGTSWTQRSGTVREPARRTLIPLQ
jgi:rubrerythrin